MKKFFQIRNGDLVSTSESEATVVLVLNPTVDERNEIGLALEDSHTMNSMLDPEEGARIEVEEKHVVMIWKRPKNATIDGEIQFLVNTAGLIYEEKRLTFVCEDENITFEGKDFRAIRSVQDLILRRLLYSIHHFQEHLKVIKLITAELQVKLNHSMENHYFLQMFALSESLVYFLDALESNAALLQKLRRAGKALNFSEKDFDLLDDIIIEQAQCSRQAEIHSQVLAGLMDARGNIINNNMNVLLKNLTLINVVFLPLNLLAGIGGMSELPLLLSPIEPNLAFLLFTLAQIPLAFLTWILLSRWLDKTSQLKKRAAGTRSK